MILEANEREHLSSDSVGFQFGLKGKWRKQKKPLKASDIQLAGTSSLPQSNEIEVSIFGPGHGECVVLHLGFNEWIIVDSCIDRTSGEPSALAYLRKLSVDPSKAVRMIVASHWHDDHIRGLAALFKECLSAEFVCSEALRPREFVTLVTAYDANSMMDSSGVKEFGGIIKTLIDRKDGPPPRFGIADRCLWHEDRPMNGESVRRSVHTLSPCDEAIRVSHQQISGLIPSGGTRKKRLPVLSPNNAAVVLWVEVGPIRILLGADLEEAGNKNSGWQAILGSHGRPQGRASFFKIPHHGSVTADLPEVWSSLLVENPFAGTTPFVRQKTPLPTSQDIARLCSRTSNGYLTAGVKDTGKRRRPNTVQKQIDQSTRRLQIVDPPTGQVRFRCALEKGNPPQWSAKVFGGALRLSEVYPNRLK